MQNPLHNYYPFNFGVFDLSSNGSESLVHPGLDLGRALMMGRSPSASPSQTPSPVHVGTGHAEPAMSHLLFQQSLFGENGPFGGGYRQGYALGHGGREEVDNPGAQLSSATAAVAAAAYYQDKMFKKVSEGGKSFTIDALLGLNNAEARAAFQSRMADRHHPLGGGGGMNLTMAMEWNRQHFHHPGVEKVAGLNVTGANGKDRIHPYISSLCNNSPSSNKRKAPSGNGHTTSGTNTTRDKPQDEAQNLRRVGKAKRVRTIFTPEQLERLEAEFERQQYMVGPERLYLASSLNLTEAQVKVWFQNRRIKWRKQHLEVQQQRLAVLRSQQLDLDEDGSSEFGSSASSPTPTVGSASIPETAEPEARTGQSFQPKSSSTGEDSPGTNESMIYNTNQHGTSQHLKIESARTNKGGFELDYQAR